MSKKVTVVGAGGTGICTAADLTLSGHHVTLCDIAGRSDDRIEMVRARGGVNLTGKGQNGFAVIENITTDFSQAIPGAEIIIICALSTRHVEIAQAVIPHLEDGQTILFSAGNMGSILFRQEMVKAGCKKAVVTGELEGNMFPCRLYDNAEGFIGMPFKPRTAAAFPAKDNDALVAALCQLWETHAATNVFETSLNASNIVVHLGGSLLNTSLVEQTENFCFYDQGLTPSVLKVIEATAAERDAINGKLGYPVRSSVGFMKQLADKENFPQFESFRGLEGPLTMADRYIFEDAQSGSTFLNSVGQAVGVDTPLARAFVAIASAINGADYASTGVTMERLGMAGLDAEGINKFLYEGPSAN